MKRNRAVMEDRAPASTEDEDPRRALWRKLEWFGTPPWACRAGAELVRRLDPLCESVWEPAAGDGIMAECLRETFPRVFASDIHPQGPIGAKIDFLDPHVDLAGIQACWIVTNPPFGLFTQFLERGLKLARTGVALLGRLSVLESEDRYRALYAGADPLTVLAPFSERVAMQLGPWDPECSTATAYAWFVFKKEPSRHRWAARIHPIAPGTRARLSKRNDAHRFGAKREAPLFNALTE